MSNCTVHAGLRCDNCRSNAIGQLFTTQTGNDCQACGWRVARHGGGWRLRVAGGRVRAGEDVNGGKWEEMNHPLPIATKKREPASKPSPRKPKCHFFLVPYLVQYQLIYKRIKANYNKRQRNSFDVMCLNALIFPQFLINP